MTMPGARDDAFKIWVDADACPRVIKEILFRAAEREQVHLTLVAHRLLHVPPSPFLHSLRVPGGFDEADRRIAGLMQPALSSSRPTSRSRRSWCSAAAWGSIHAARPTPRTTSPRCSPRETCWISSGARDTRSAARPPSARASARRSPTGSTACCSGWLAPRATGPESRRCRQPPGRRERSRGWPARAPDRRPGRRE